MQKFEPDPLVGSRSCETTCKDSKMHVFCKNIIFLEVIPLSVSQSHITCQPGPTRPPTSPDSWPSTQLMNDFHFFHANWPPPRPDESAEWKLSREKGPKKRKWHFSHNFWTDMFLKNNTIRCETNLGGGWYWELALISYSYYRSQWYHACYHGIYHDPINIFLGGLRPTPPSPQQKYWSVAFNASQKIWLPGTGWPDPPLLSWSGYWSKPVSPPKW